MKRILLVDGVIEFRNEVYKSLGGRFDLVFVSSLTEARRELEKKPVDLILLETVLSDGDSFSWCATLKAESHTSQIPVIFLSESSSIGDKVRGFTVGADDYMVKPMDLLELEVRIHARLKGYSIVRDQEQILQKGDITLSVPYQKALLQETGSEKDLRLTPTEFRLLYFFIKNEGVVLSRSQLLATIWSDDVHVLARTIDKHISTLKKKLASRSSYIQSVHSRGYCFSLKKSYSSEAPVDSFMSI